MLNDEQVNIDWVNVFLILMFIMLAAPILAIICFLVGIMIAIATLGFGAVLLIPILYMMPLWVSLIAAYFSNDYLLENYGVAYGRYGVFWGTLAASTHAWIFWSMWRNHALAPELAVPLLIAFPLTGALIGYATLRALHNDSIPKAFVHALNILITGALVYSLLKLPL